MTHIALIHSPFVGPLTWRGVADRLAAQGHVPVVPDLRGDEPEAVSIWRSQCERVVRAVRSETAGREVWLVAHSGAGPLLPAIDEGLGGAAGWVFVDATLPHPGRSRLDTMPGELRRRVLSAGSSVAPWVDWFPAEVLRRVLPDPAQRAAFAAEAPALSPALLHEPMPDVAVPSRRRCSYVQLSEAYTGSARAAADREWRVERIEGDHLWPVTHPEEVAAAILRAVDPSARR